MTKTEYRRRLRELPELGAEDISARNQSICEQVRSLPEWTNARVVAVYAASHHEPSLDDLWLHDESRVFAFPRVEGSGLENERLQFFRVSTPAELLASRWGLREPDPSAELIKPETLDLVIVPGVAFTKTGARLGRGRGHYDRFLPRLRPDAVVIGICFRERLLPEIPTEAHDILMRHVISA